MCVLKHVLCVCVCFFLLKGRMGAKQMPFLLLSFPSLFSQCPCHRNHPTHNQNGGAGGLDGKGGSISSSAGSVVTPRPLSAKASGRGGEGAIEGAGARGTMLA